MDNSFGYQALLNQSEINASNFLFTGLTADQLLYCTSAGNIESVANLTSYVAGTTSQINVANDGDGTITLSTPQNIATTSSPSFANLTLDNGLVADTITFSHSGTTRGYITNTYTNGYSTLQGAGGIGLQVNLTEKMTINQYGVGLGVTPTSTIGMSIYNSSTGTLTNICDSNALTTTGTVKHNSLTASQLVVTNASKELTSTLFPPTLSGLLVNGDIEVYGIINAGYLPSVSGGFTLYPSNSYGKPALQSISSGGTPDTWYVNPDGGNVLIGTTSGSDKLTVAGSISSSSNITATNNLVCAALGVGTSSPATQIQISSTSGAGKLAIGSSDGVPNNDELQFRSAYSGLLNSSDITASIIGACENNGGRMIFNTSHNNTGTLTEAMRINAFGNLGIGTSTPSVKLDINDQTAAFTEVLRIRGNYSADGYGSYINFTDSTPTNIARIGTVRESNNNVGLSFGTFNSGYSEKVRISAAGNFGIGTTPSSTYKAIIAQDGAFGAGTHQLVLSGKSNTNKQLQLGYDTTNNYGFIQSTTVGSTYDSLCLNPGGGYVGINTTPSYPLHVAAGSSSVTCNITGTNTNTGAVQCAIASTCTYKGTAGGNYAQSILSNPTFAPAASTTISNASCFYATPSFTGNAGTVSYATGFFYDGGGSTVGTITNAYGMYIANPSHGTNKYGAYIGGKVGIGIGAPVASLQVGASIGGPSSYANYALLAYDAGSSSGSYGLGVESSYLWANSATGHKLYCGGTEYFRLTSSGAAITGAISSTTSISVPYSGYLQVNNGNLSMGNYSIACVPGSGNYPMRFCGSSDFSTNRYFEFGNYSSDNPGSTWNSKFSINSYNGNTTTSGTLTTSGKAAVGTTSVSGGSSLRVLAPSQGTDTYIGDEVDAINTNGQIYTSACFRAPLTTPASSSASGTTGQIKWDASYIYICTGTNTWKRVALSTF